MRREVLAVALWSAVSACSGTPSGPTFGAGASGGSGGAGVDSGATGGGGAGSGGAAGAGVVTGGAAGAGSGGTAGAPVADGSSGSAGTDAGSAPDVGEAGTPDAGGPSLDAGADFKTDVLVGADTGDGGTATPDAPREAGSDGASDAPPRADSAPPSDAQEGGLPPTCAYAIESVAKVTWPYDLCGTTTKVSPYSFSELRFRRPIFDPPPFDAFTDGVLTVKNGATVTTYMGASWQDPEGEQIRFTGPGGTTSIVLQAGVNEISVTTHDVSAKTGCLPQPCTWTVAP